VYMVWDNDEHTGRRISKGKDVGHLIP
jgi:hypothetical protein